MYYHLILTDECNLNCSYCRGKDYFLDEAGYNIPEYELCQPSVPEYELDVLSGFLRKDLNPVVLFYGGEPMLQPELIVEYMDGLPFCSFSIYTNGTLIDSLPPDYVRKLGTIILSIDGDQKTTDNYRGKGVYERVLKNIEYIRECGFSGEIIGRITVAEDTDIYNSVIHLSEDLHHAFDSVHWQMDANFWYDYSSRPQFREWITESYNPGIKRLADKWLEQIKATGKVPRWYPFCGLVYDILTGEPKNLLRCGAGHRNYAIQTDGNIVPCPCMSGMKDYYCGNITYSEPSELKKVNIEGFCKDCEILDFCGGRCLYSNILCPWPEEGRDLVFESVKNLKISVESLMPSILSMVMGGEVCIEDFHIDKYNGCEIIP